MTRSMLVALSLAGCASARGGDRAPQAPVSIAAVTEVCDILRRDPLSPAATREALGRSALPAVRAARVPAAAGAAEPNIVELDLPAAVPLAAFERAYGAGSEGVQLHLGEPIEWVYYTRAPTQPRVTCAIIARLAGDGSVRFVTVRRDRHG